MNFKITKKEIEKLYEIVNQYDSSFYELILIPTGIGPTLTVRIFTTEDTLKYILNEYGVPIEIDITDYDSW